MAEDNANREVHHPTRRKLLTVLSGSDGELNKSDLAMRVYGESNSSTRAMTTRATAALVAAGLLEERLQGRERLVRLSTRGHALVLEWNSKSANADTWREVDKALESVPVDHALLDRQRFHLRHAALLALSALHSRNSDADKHYRQVLLALIDERSNPAADLQFFRDYLVPTWPRDDVARLLLAECILRFQAAGFQEAGKETLYRAQARERRSTFSDLILVGDAFGDDLTRDPYLQPADILVWATCATAVAHHHLLEPDSEFRRISARGVVQRAVRLLDVLKKQANPANAVALAYRQALAGTVVYGTWEWAEPPSTKSRSDDPIGRIINGLAEKADLEVCASAEANQAIIRYELALTQGPGFALVSALPDAEPIFRRVHHRDATRELSEWAHDRKDVLADILPRTVARDPRTVNQLRAFKDQSAQIAARNPTIAKCLAPHRKQCAFLLGERFTGTNDVTSPMTPAAHAAMVLNNLWTPEMVAADVAASVS